MPGAVERSGEKQVGRDGCLYVLLRLGLALWLGTLPVVQVLHLGFANHDHRFLLEANGFVDVPRASSQDARTSDHLQAREASSFTPHLRPVQSGSGWDRSSLCAVCNPSVSIGSLVGPVLTASTTWVVAGGPVVPQRAGSSCHGALILIAPKASPPAAA